MEKVVTERVDTAAVAGIAGKLEERRQLTVMEEFNEAIERHCREVATLQQRREEAVRLGIAHLHADKLREFAYPGSF